MPDIIATHLFHSRTSQPACRTDDLISASDEAV